MPVRTVGKLSDHRSSASRNGARPAWNGAARSSRGVKADASVRSHVSEDGEDLLLVGEWEV
jgi:hypothetical protein